MSKKPTASAEKIDFKALQKVPREWLHKARNWSKADVWRAEWPVGSGQYIVVKDMRGRPMWFRATAGRYFMKREMRALRTLDGMEGVPRAFAMPNPDCIVMEWRAGTPAIEFRNGQISPVALENLRRLMDEVHARGVVHCDLHRDNVLIGDDDSVCLIDWATASVFAPDSKRWTRQEWAALDDRAVAKIKVRHLPQMLSEDELQLLTGGSPLYAIIRNLGHWFRKLRGAKPKRTPAEIAERYRMRLKNEGMLPEKEPGPGK